MKKILYLAALAVASLGFTACNSDDSPVLQYPEAGDFVLNEPVMANQTVQLVKGGTLEFVCSQPDYGVAVQSYYSLEASLTSDFAEYVTLTPSNANSTTIVIKDNDLAVGLCELLGYTSRDLYQNNGPIPVYFRAYCYLNKIDGTGVYSNVVELKSVELYYAAAEPGTIWTIGDFPFANWTEPSEANASTLTACELTETGVETGIYEGTFEVNANPTFRFYTALTGWDGGDSIGYQEADASTSFEFTDGYFTSSCMVGKGSWNFPNFAGGTIKMVVNLNEMKVQFYAAAAGEVNWDALDCMWLIGDQSGWLTPNENNEAALADWRIYDVNGNGVYVTKEPFNMTAGGFRFYYELNSAYAYDGWGDDDDNASVGANKNDGDNLSISLPYSGNLSKPGKGNWVIDQACKLDITVDTSNNTVTFTPVED